MAVISGSPLHWASSSRASPHSPSFSIILETMAGGARLGSRCAWGRRSVSGGETPGFSGRKLPLLDRLWQEVPVKDNFQAIFAGWSLRRGREGTGIGSPAGAGSRGSSVGLDGSGAGMGQTGMGQTGTGQTGAGKAERARARRLFLFLAVLFKIQLMQLIKTYFFCFFLFFGFATLFSLWHRRVTLSVNNLKWYQKSMKNI